MQEITMNWYQEPASNRQTKVMKFFRVPMRPGETKGDASRAITAIFKYPGNREKWLKYVYLTGDEGQDTPDLLPFDPGQIDSVVVPAEWKPHRSKIKKTKGFERERLLEMVTDILKEGVPFDDPVPMIEYPSRHFCFTGKFSFGTRTQCQQAVSAKGGIPDDDVNLDTNYLIVGGELSPAWANESYGRKIEKALIYKLEDRPIVLLTEAEWTRQLK
jgi:NAD-dependent DNA ligase